MAHISPQTEEVLAPAEDPQQSETSIPTESQAQTWPSKARADEVFAGTATYRAARKGKKFR